MEMVAFKIKKKKIQQWRSARRPRPQRHRSLINSHILMPGAGVRFPEWLWQLPGRSMKMIELSRKIGQN